MKVIILVKSYWNLNILLQLNLYCVTEYAGNLGEDGDKEWQEQEQRHILKMVDKL